jgi:hypothetical protein
MYKYVCVNKIKLFEGRSRFICLWMSTVGGGGDQACILSPSVFLNEWELEKENGNTYVYIRKRERVAFSHSLDQMYI